MDGTDGRLARRAILLFQTNLNDCFSPLSHLPPPGGSGGSGNFSAEKKTKKKRERKQKQKTKNKKRKKERREEKEKKKNTPLIRERFGARSIGMEIYPLIEGKKISAETGNDPCGDSVEI